MATRKASDIDPRPLIGICSRQTDDAEPAAAIAMSYVNRVREAGGIPIILPHGVQDAEIASDFVARLDGLLLTGGGDICADSFGGHPYAEVCKAAIHYQSAERDAFEYAMLLAAWDVDLPVLGICRGMQVMNVSFGGTNVRDVSELEGKRLSHARFGCGKQIAHRVSIESDSLLFEVLGTDDLAVNSMHHQAIYHPAPAARITAQAPDGTPEGLEFPERTFFLGVQWHPEQICNTPQLFEAFVDAARARLLAR